MLPSNKKIVDLLYLFQKAIVTVDYEQRYATKESIFFYTGSQSNDISFLDALGIESVYSIFTSQKSIIRVKSNKIVMVLLQ